MAYIPGKINFQISGNTSGTSASISSGTMVFAGGNNITLSQHSSNSNAITIVGGSAGSHTFGMSNLGNVAGTNGVVSGSNVRVLFAGGNNITLSQQINSGSATLTIVGPPMFDAGVSNIGNTAGVTGTNTNGLFLVGGNNVTLSQSTNVSGAYVSINAGGGIALAGGGTTYATGTANISAAGGALTIASTTGQGLNFSVPATSQIIGTNGISMSSSSESISIGLDLPKRWHELYVRPTLTNITNLTAINGRPIFQPFFNQGNLSINQMDIELSRSTSGSNLFTIRAGIFSYVNDTQVSLLASLSNSYSNTLTASVSGIVRLAVSNFNITTFAPGEYVMGMLFTAAATASMNYSLRGGSTLPVQYIQPGSDLYIISGSNAGIPFLGRYTTTTASMPASLAASQLFGFGTATSVQAINWWQAI
ncbi:MAG: hypothetical protein JWN33_188 [Candidatus Saccharibacteria bacterium]|nr:hypothetical protein [Candidatus Saccharibacteria bacterium]